MPFSSAENKIMLSMAKLDWSFSDDLARVSKTSVWFIDGRLKKLIARGMVELCHLNPAMTVYRITNAGLEYFNPSAVQSVTLSPSMQTISHADFMEAGRKQVVDALDSYMQEVMGHRMVSGVLDADMADLFKAIDPFLIRQKDRINHVNSDVQNSHLIQIGKQ